MRSADELVALAEEGVRICKRLGAEHAEVYVNSGEATSINAIGRYAVPTEAFDEGLAVRAVIGGRLGQSGSSGATTANIERVARHALDAARRHPDAAGFRGFPGAFSEFRAPTSIHPALAAPDLKRVSAAVEALSERVAATPLVTYAGAGMTSWRSRWAVANSEGATAWDHRAGERAQLEVRVSRGASERTAGAMRATDRPIHESYDLAALADEVVARGASALDAERLDSPVTEIIATPGPVLQLVKLFTPAFSAPRVRARQSPFAGKLGERVAHEALTIRDAPEGRVGIAPQRVDHEGTPTRDLTLLDAGRAESWLYDHDAALREGRASTGHGLRAGVTGGIGVRPINLEVAGGDASLEELIEQADRAVFVNEALMGGFVANDTTGDFSLVAPFAFLVENGRIRHALPPTTLGGNVHRALGDVKGVTRERLTTPGGIYPSLWLGGVSCAT